MIQQPLRDYLSRYRRYFVHAGIFSLFFNLLQIALPLYMLQLFDRVLSSRSVETLLMLTVVTLGALGVMLLLDILRSRLLLALALRFDLAVGPDVLNGLLRQAIRGPFSDAKASLRDVAVLRGFLSGQGLTACFDAPWVLPYIFLIFLMHPVLGMVALTGALMLYGLAWVNEIFSRRSVESISEQTQCAAQWINGGLRNAEVIAALGMREAILHRWQVHNRKVLDLLAVSGYSGSIITGVSRWTRQMIQVAMLAAGAYLIINQEGSPGIMIAATIILARALGPVEAMISSWKNVVEARRSYQRLESLLEEFGQYTGTQGLPMVWGRLEVENVSFSHKTTDNRAVLHRINFRLQAGESLAVIGPSAAGKSTLARLLVGIWSPQAGAVRLDGMSLAEWEKENLGRHLGYLPQDVELFAGTVAENISRLQSSSFEPVITAAQLAGAHNMILRLPKGYDTEIGEGGGLLSAGQRQRIGLARALFGTPRLVVLDEPNANLDAEGEQELIKALQGMKESGMTVVLITHKPSITSGMDKMLVLQAGQIKLFGQRAEVMTQLGMNAGDTPMQKDTV
jgi:ATP-binding cassette subfamily C exporter for protease/lipase/ATP-binding cassette subfamily C protein EexD